MKPTPFDYHRPETAAEAASLLADLDGAALMAGNQTLGMEMSYRESTPDHLVDVGGLDDLAFVAADGERLEVGATTLHRTLAADETVAHRLPMLATAAAAVAGPSVRNRGTFGGSVGRAHPAGNYPTVLVAMDATLRVRSPDGVREVAVGDYLDAGLERGDLIESAAVPLGGFPPAETGTAFRQQKRAKLTWPTINACAAVRVDDPGDDAPAVRAARVGLANATPRQIRVAGAERAVEGTPLDADALDAAAAAARDAADPTDEMHADADYKREMAGEYARRALAAAYEDALAED